jgi:hypothetical protein
LGRSVGFGRCCDCCKRAGGDATAAEEAQYCLHAYGQFGLRRVGRLNGGGILRGAPTPNIDRLASEGMRLLNFNVEAQCTPSRSAFITGRFSIRSGTFEVPIGGVPDELTQWEVTLPQLLSAQGYATGIWGKWHLGSAEARLPTNRGFDEWYGIPRTYDEAMWPSLNETNSIWPSVGDKLILLHNLALASDFLPSTTRFSATGGEPGQ